MSDTPYFQPHKGEDDGSMLDRKKLLKRIDELLTHRQVLAATTAVCFIAYRRQKNLVKRYAKVALEMERKLNESQAELEASRHLMVLLRKSA